MLLFEFMLLFGPVLLELVPVLVLLEPELLFELDVLLG